MEKSMWLTRQRHSGAMARKAGCSKSRLIHLEMAGRYSIKAANAAQDPVEAPVVDAASGPADATSEARS